MGQSESLRQETDLANPDAAGAAQHQQYNQIHSSIANYSALRCLFRSETFSNCTVDNTEGLPDHQYLSQEREETEHERNYKEIIRGNKME